MKEPSLGQKLIKTFQANNQQLAFGSYAAELSFYVIWALVPLMLAFANVIAVLPFTQTEIISVIEAALPSEVEEFIIPLLQSYLTDTSTGIFSIGLIISLWPASNVFNTMQRVLNTIYKSEARKNFFIARVFAYVFTLIIVIVVISFTFVLVFGDIILQFIRDFFFFELTILNIFVQQGWLLGIIGLFILVLLIYHFMPNVKWSIKYALPGTIFTVLGFVLVSQLFTLYLAIAGGNIGSGTIGVFIVLIIWLYLNAMVIAIGAYINVFYHDFKEKSYWKLVEETTSYQVFNAYSDNFKQHNPLLPKLTNTVYKGIPRTQIEKGERYDVDSTKSKK